MTDAEAEAFLEANEKQIRDDMVARGWDSIETILHLWRHRQT